MSAKSCQIVVAGDVAVDWYMHPVDARDDGDNWHQYPSEHYSAIPGGALLLADFISRFLQAAQFDADVAAPHLPGPLRAICPREIIHSNARLGVYYEMRNGRETAFLRVEKPLGYIGPSKNVLPLSCPPVPNPPQADLIVLDDAGNGFRRDPASWPAALDAAGQSLVVYKMSRPLTFAALWEKLGKRLPAHLVLVVNIEDLRRCRGVRISRALSWEQTAKDFVFQIQRCESLIMLRSCPRVVVCFETDGAMIYQGCETRCATLLFDPGRLEGGYAMTVGGSMIGRTSLVTASIVEALARNGPEGLEDGVRLGLARSRALLAAGYKKTDGNTDPDIAYPYEELLQAGSAAADYASCCVTPPKGLRNSDPGFWRILDDKTRNTRLRVAEKIVLCRHTDGLRGVPVAALGEIQVVDRAEIEHYGTICELIREFLDTPHPRQPLCFAVFGPPGSGKSFAVTQVIKSLNSRQVEPKTFNVSQFRSYDDLVAALQWARDVALTDKVPLVFFDEFDARREGQALGWMKYFLAPMQDGKFKHGESTYNTGKIIMAFAGGTKSSFEEFEADARSEDGAAPGDAKSRERGEKVPREAKVLDFISRLRGFINIMGLNRQRKPGEDDDAFIIRRAMILRVLLRRAPAAADLFDSQANLRIDPGVLRALLHVRTYTHGARSMEVILDMSRLAGHSRFDLSNLPPPEQLAPHVDPEEFMFLAEQERYQSMFCLRDLRDPNEPSFRKNENNIVEAVARMIHEKYQETSGKKDAYDDLPEDFKRSNIDVAEDIPHKLVHINCGIRRIQPDGPENPAHISDEEYEQLATLEQERFCAERGLQGWTYGEKRDNKAKTDPNLVPYHALSEDVKKHNRAQVRAIPDILKRLGYEIYRMEEPPEPDPAAKAHGTCVKPTG